MQAFTPTLLPIYMKIANMIVPLSLDKKEAERVFYSIFKPSVFSGLGPEAQRAASDILRYFDDPGEYEEDDEYDEEGVRESTLVLPERDPGSMTDAIIAEAMRMELEMLALRKVKLNELKAFYTTAIAEAVSGHLESGEGEKHKDAADRILDLFDVFMNR